MKQYKVFKHPSGTVEAVKQGWSWPAFFFNWIWAMVKKQWLLGSSVFICYALFIFLLMSSVSSEEELIAVSVLNQIVSLIIIVTFGIKGNSLREKNLVSRGYEYADTVTAANPEGALALYLKSVSK